MEKIEEQFERVRRYYMRFEKIALGQEHLTESEYYQDDVYAFFQNIWHLKDWIINNAEHVDKGTVKAYFENDTDFKICRDLANGTKHSKIKDPSVDPNIRVTRREYSLMLGSRTTISANYILKVKGYPPLDAFALAGTCVAKAEAFLRKHKLISN